MYSSFISFNLTLIQSPLVKFCSLLAVIHRKLDKISDFQQDMKDLFRILRLGGRRNGNQLNLYSLSFLHSFPIGKKFYFTPRQASAEFLNAGKPVWLILVVLQG